MLILNILNIYKNIKLLNNFLVTEELAQKKKCFLTKIAKLTTGLRPTKCW